MATELSKTVSVVDSAIGPVMMERAEVVGYDVDDYVKSTIESQATWLKMRAMALLADPKFTKDRPPVNLDDVTAGGWRRG